MYTFSVTVKMSFIIVMEEYCKENLFDCKLPLTGRKIGGIISGGNVHGRRYGTIFAGMSEQRR